MVKIELVISAVTLCASLLGSAYSGVYKYGELNDKVNTVQAHQTQQDQQISKNADIVTDERIHDAHIQEKLDAIAIQLDRIEKAVK